MKHVVFITVDSLRADYVFGPTALESLETLPRMADEWLSFPNTFANAPYTKQSFLSILSGTYPWMFDATEGGFEPDRPHIAEQLSDAGYETGGFHTNTYLSPTYNYDRGFDHYLGRDTGNGDGGEGPVSTAFNKAVERAVATKGLSDGVFWVYKNTGKHLGIQLGSNLYEPGQGLNDLAVDWMRERSGPTFTWIHYMDVHNPYYPHKGTVSEGISRRRAVKLFHRVNEQRGDADESDLQTLERLYRGEVEYFDRQLGSLLERIDRTLGLEDTLVAFTADHGEAFNEKGHVFHPGSALYDENIHVPMMIRGPDIESGEVETPVSNADIVPTILRRVGIDPPSSMVGDDLTSLADDSPDERIVFTESFDRESGGVMATDGRFKLIRDLETGEESLYDREERPKESTDHRDEYPSVARKLRSATDEHIRSTRRDADNEAEVDVGEDVRLQLRKLGYDE